MEWKDTLLPGASRTPLPYDGSLLPGWVLDTYGPPTERNDWVMGPNGPAISGSGEADWNNPNNFAGGVVQAPPAGVGPSPGFFPVDAGQYGANPWFAGRGVASLLGATDGANPPYANPIPGVIPQNAGLSDLLGLLSAPAGQSKSLGADQLAALRKALERMQFQIPS